MVFPVDVLVVTIRPAGVKTALRGAARITGLAGAIAGLAAVIMGFAGGVADLAGAMAGRAGAIIGLAGLAAFAGAGAMEFAGAAWAVPDKRVIAARTGVKRRNDIELLPKTNDADCPLAEAKMILSGWPRRCWFMTFASHYDRFAATLWFKGRSCAEAR